MHAIKGAAIVVTSITALTLAGGALSSKGKHHPERPPRDDHKQTVAVPEGGSTLMLLGIGLLGVEGFRRWANRNGDSQTGRP